MVKRTNKKRNKPYQGPDAASAQPTVHRYTAVKRGPVREWWHEKRRIIKVLGIVLGVVVLLFLIIAELIGLLMGGV